MRWLAVWLLLSLGAAAQAAAFSAADAGQVRRVVQFQLAAFAADDAQRAFSYAAPPIRKSMGTAANFMRMVRSNYAVVYRPASVTFLQPEGRGDQARLRVHMTDAQGVAWLVTYHLQRQKNRRWQISACELLERSSRMI